MQWTKPSGVVININTNKATEDYAESLGWKRVKKAPVKKSAKKVAK